MLPRVTLINMSNKLTYAQLKKIFQKKKGDYGFGFSCCNIFLV